MDFHTYTTMRDWMRRADPDDRPAQDIDRFYRRAQAEAGKMGSAQFFAQMLNERDWEQARKRPDAPARAYLTVIARNPDAVARLLGEAA